MRVVEKLAPIRCEAIHMTVLLAVKALPCSCYKWFDLCPFLANVSRHLILRTPEQWVQLLGLMVGKLLGGNPRNRISPSHDLLLADLQNLESNVQNATVPVFSETAGTFQPVKLSSGRRAGILAFSLSSAKISARLPYTTRGWLTSLFLRPKSYSTHTDCGVVRGIKRLLGPVVSAGRCLRSIGQTPFMVSITRHTRSTW